MNKLNWRCSRSGLGHAKLPIVAVVVVASSDQQESSDQQASLDQQASSGQQVLNQEELSVLEHLGQVAEVDCMTISWVDDQDLAGI